MATYLILKNLLIAIAGILHLFQQKTIANRLGTIIDSATKDAP